MEKQNVIKVLQSPVSSRCVQVKPYSTWNTESQKTEDWKSEAHCVHLFSFFFSPFFFFLLFFLLIINDLKQLHYCFNHFSPISLMVTTCLNIYICFNICIFCIISHIIFICTCTFFLNKAFHGDKFNKSFSLKVL